MTTCADHHHNTPARIRDGRELVLRGGGHGAEGSGEFITALE